MAWVVTLKVTACSSSAKLPGAWITDGAVTYYTDANAQFIAIINDAYHTYIVNIGKSGYLSKNFSIHRGTMEGTTQTICLDAAPPSGGGGNGGGW